jgi:hypothetical protein
MTDIGRVHLHDHQRAALHACKVLERGERHLERVPFATDPGETLETRIGAFCDAPGAGKSYVMLALCASTSSPLPRPQCRLTHVNGCVSYTVLDGGASPLVRRCNVIVVPHGLVGQWTQYAADVGFASGEDDDVPWQIVVCKRAHFFGLSNRMAQAPAGSVIIVSSTFFRQFVHEYATAATVMFDRVIVDEADSIVLGASELPMARMTWYVTGSPIALLVPFPSLTYCHHLNGYVRASSGVRSRCVKSVFVDLRNHGIHARHLLFVRSDESFVASCANLLPPAVAFVTSHTPISVRVLSGLADQQIMDALNTDDEALALTFVENAGPVDNIVKLLYEGWHKRKEYLEQALANMGGLTDEDRAPIAKKVTNLQKLIDNVETRIASADDMCGICYEPMRMCSITPCCTAQYCFACVSRWVGARGTCPTCREALQPCMLHVLTDAPRAPRPPDKRSNAIELARTVIAHSDSNRILICCANEGVFPQLMSDLNAAGIPSDRIKGTAGAIKNSVARFRDGRVRAVCVASNMYCAGMNLEFVTDVVMYSRMDPSTERQAVGRAQRAGRKGQLRVWYLVHENEVTERAPETVAQGWARLNGRV